MVSQQVPSGRHLPTHTFLTLSWWQKYSLHNKDHDEKLPSLQPLTHLYTVCILIYVACNASWLSNPPKVDLFLITVHYERFHFSYTTTICQLKVLIPQSMKNCTFVILILWNAHKISSCYNLHYSHNKHLFPHQPLSPPSLDVNKTKTHSLSC